MATKPVPQATPDSQPFWDGTRVGELRIQRCTGCRRHYFYPRPQCPHCGGEQVEWVRASGSARLYSYVINHRPAPGFADDVPYVIAVVELAEGPRMMTNIVGVTAAPENLPLDMPLRVTFEDRDGMMLPMFEPADGAGTAAGPTSTAGVTGEEP